MSEISKRGSGTAGAIAGSQPEGHLLMRLGAFLFLTVAGAILLALPYANIH
jgi:hypothetical protein